MFFTNLRPLTLLSRVYIIDLSRSSKIKRQLKYNCTVVLYKRSDDLSYSLALLSGWVII